MEPEARFILKEENSLFYDCNTCYKDLPIIETRNENLYPDLQKKELDINHYNVLIF